MSQVTLSSSENHDFILIASDEDEVINLRNFMITNDDESEELFNKKFRRKDIIAFGVSFEVTEAEARRFIPRDKHTEGRSEYLYKCVMPYNKGRCFLSHYDAKSAWYCALERIGNPYHALLVRVPVVRKIVYE